jgi:hypothetical protein
MTGMDYYMAHPRWNKRIFEIIRHFKYEPIKAKMYLVDYKILVIYAIVKKRKKQSDYEFYKKVAEALKGEVRA